VHPEWDWDRLEERTGVFSRYLAGPSETALDFAVAACTKLAAGGQLQADAIDAVVFCTQTPDFIMPPNACLLHDKLDLGPDVLAFDISLACSGYIYGLQIARDLIAGGARSVLLATADTYSRLIHPDDRATFCLFGDGGAVSVIGPAADGTGIVDIRCGTSGKHANRFIVPAGGARVPRSAETAVVRRDRGGNLRTAEHITMDGMGVLSFFNSLVPDEVRRILVDNNLTADDVDWFIFHQASRVALQSIRRALAVPDRKVIEMLAEVGNLVSASIPVTLERAQADGRIRPGQLLLLCGFGVGLSWGTALVRT
jgi:3-oxoacyl-[acyl-carrier-protein] synthase-3